MLCTVSVARHVYASGITENYPSIGAVVQNTVCGVHKLHRRFNAETNAFRVRTRVSCVYVSVVLVAQAGVWHAFELSSAQPHV